MAIREKSDMNFYVRVNEGLPAKWMFSKKKHGGIEVLENLDTSSCAQE